MQKFTTNKLIKQFILNNSNLYQFKPYYQYNPTYKIYGFSDTYKLQNNFNYSKCNRHKFYLQPAFHLQPLKQLLNQLQTQYPLSFKYKLDDIVNYENGEIIALRLTTYNLFN